MLPHQSFGQPQGIAPTNGNRICPRRCLCRTKGNRKGLPLQTEIGFVGFIPNLTPYQKGNCEGCPYVYNWATVGDCTNVYNYGVKGVGISVFCLILRFL